MQEVVSGLGVAGLLTVLELQKLGRLPILIYNGSTYISDESYILTQNNIKYFLEKEIDLIGYIRNLNTVNIYSKDGEVFNVDTSGKLFTVSKQDLINEIIFQYKKQGGMAVISDVSESNYEVLKVSKDLDIRYDKLLVSDISLERINRLIIPSNAFTMSICAKGHEVADTPNYSLRFKKDAPLLEEISTHIGSTYNLELRRNNKVQMVSYYLGGCLWGLDSIEYRRAVRSDLLHINKNSVYLVGESLLFNDLQIFTISNAIDYANSYLEEGLNQWRYAKKIEILSRKYLHRMALIESIGYSSNQKARNDFQNIIEEGVVNG